MEFKSAEHRTQWFVNILGTMIMVLGFTVMLGWFFKIPAIIQIFPNFAPMQFNTALCFSFSALAVLFYHKRNSFLVMLSATIIMIVSILNILEYWFDTDLGIDRLFIEPFLNINSLYPGRMALNTAICFVLFSIFIYLSQRKSRLVYFFTILLPCIFGVLSLISIIGYIFDVEQAYSWAASTYMAPHTAIGFVLLAIVSFMLARSNKHRPKNRTSNMLDYAVTLATLLFFLVLFQAMRLNYISDLKNEASNQINIINTKLATEIQRQVEAIIRLFSRYNYKSYSTTHAFNLDIDNCFKDMRSLKTISFYNAGKMVTKTTPFSTINIPDYKIECSIFNSKPARDNHLQISEAYGYFCMKNGHISAIINLKDIASQSMQHDSNNFNIVVKINDKLLYANNFIDSRPQALWNEKEHINIYGNDLLISVSPTREYIKYQVGRAPYIILILGVFCSFLVYFILNYRRKLIYKEKALISSEIIKNTILNSAVEGVIGVNKNHEIYFMNQSAQKLLNAAVDGKLQISLNDLTKNSKSSGHEIILNVNKAFYTGQSIAECTDIIQQMNGASLPIRYSVSPLIENNVILGVIIIFTDNSERLAYEEKLRSMALYDYLTNLPNRFYIISHLKESISRAQRHLINFSVCYLDIDNFKSINDKYGHNIGDKVLQYVATIISEKIRNNDFLGRLSGDEFCLILDGVTTKNDIEAVLKKIYKSFELPFNDENISILVCLSIGYIPYTGENTPEELLVKADAEMYKNKKSF